MSVGTRNIQSPRDNTVSSIDCEDVVGLKRPPGRSISGSALRDAHLALGRPPIDRGPDGIELHTVLVLLGCLDQHLDSGVFEEVGLEPECRQLCCHRVVVVLFLLDPRVGNVVDRDIASSDLRGPLCKIDHRKRLGELVEDSILAGFWRIDTGQLDTGERVADVQHAARLAALAVDGEWVADRRLN